MSPNSRKIRVLIADDHAVVREGIKSIVSDAPDMVVVGEASDGVEAIEHAARLLPDVVVLDVQMPRGGGLETLRALRRAHPGIPVLILSFHSESVLGVPFLREGASGYLAKDNAGEALVDAIRKIKSGRKYVSDAVAESLARRLTTSAPAAPHDRLSAEELIVLSLLAAGRSVGEIAAELLLSKRAVHRCCGRILHKTGLANSAAAIQYASSWDLRAPARAGLEDNL
jgi:DNA-binding NarL/FixJ family response regulator